MVPTEMLFSRLADPSSGSIATQSGASGSSSSGTRQFLGQDRGHRATAERPAHDGIGDKIDILLRIAVGIDATILSGDADQRTVGDNGGKIDGRSRDRGDHRGDRGSLRRLQRRPIEMRTQRHAFFHGRPPVRAHFGAIPTRSAGKRSAARSTAQFAKLVKFSYLWL